jgi:hypothetical protein
MQLKADSHVQKVEGHNQPQDAASGPWSKHTINQTPDLSQHASTQFYSISALKARRLRSDDSSLSIAVEA